MTVRPGPQQPAAANSSQVVDPASNASSGNNTPAQQGWQWQKILNARRLSAQRLKLLARQWSMIALLAVAVVFLAPGWLLVIALAGIYRAGYLTGFKGKLKLGRFVTGLCILLLLMVAVMWTIRSETNKFQPASSQPDGTSRPASPGIALPTPLKMHP